MNSNRHHVRTILCTLVLVSSVDLVAQTSPVVDTAGHVGIGADHPDRSAILDLESANAGLLLPRTLPSSIPAPAKGLMIYDTSADRISLNVGTSATPEWVGLLSTRPASVWLTDGNAGLDPLRHFLGTTDSLPLIIRTADRERVRLDAAGNLGIGTSSPVERLDLVGNFRALGRGAFGTTALIDDGSLLYPGEPYTATLSLQREITGAIGGHETTAGSVDYLLLNPSTVPSTARFVGGETEVRSAADSPAGFGEVDASAGRVEHRGSGTIGTATGLRARVLNVGDGTILDGAALSGRIVDAVDGFGVRAMTLREHPTLAGRTAGAWAEVVNRSEIDAGSDSTWGARVAVTRNGRSDSGIVLTTFGAQISLDLGDGGPAIHRAYGLYIGPVVGADSNYAIYSAGGASYLAGGLGLGSGASSPRATLDVRGSTAFGDETVYHASAGDNGVIDIGAATIVRIEPPTPAASVVITGIADPVPGRMVVIIYKGPSGTNLRMLDNDSAAGVAGFELLKTGTAHSTSSGDGARIMVYSGSLERWVLVGDTN